MRNKNKLIVPLFIIFLVSLILTIYTSFSSNMDTQEIVIKSMTPVYDDASGVVVEQSNITFNDKNQVVKYNVILENTQDYDVKISDIKLSTPTEEFLDYKVEGISEDDVVSANSTKELTVSFETMGIKGWGRNFVDELTANVSFEKVVKQEEVTNPKEDDESTEEQPEAPVTNIEEIVKEAEKIEIDSITNNTIEFKDGFKVEDASKVETWIYPETEFYGYKEVDESKVIKEIVLDKNKLDELEITPGEHNVVLTTEEKEVLGYIDIYIDEDKEVLKENVEDTTDKEEIPSVDKPTTDNKGESSEEEKIENPYTSDKRLVGILGIVTCITGVAVIVASKNKISKYTVFILMLCPAFTITNADEVIEVVIKNNISFKSQNVMKMAYTLDENDEPVYNDYWIYREQLKNFYIKNEISEIKEYAYKFDVSKDQNSRVMAYLVTNSDDSNYYDLYLMADGIIYPNSNASDYFYKMRYLDKIDNIAGLDTSEVTSMYFMFSHTGQYSKVFTLDLSTFDTGNVTNMMCMFQKTGYDSPVFTLDVSSFDTSKVTDMAYMFGQTGFNSTMLKLDVGSFDTSKVTDMCAMFLAAGYSNPTFTIDVSNFDTSKVTDMSHMFSYVGYNSRDFNLNLSSFDTRNVTDMSFMFRYAGHNSENIEIDLSSFDTSKVTDMSYMFADTGYHDTDFSIDISHFNTSNLTKIDAMFYNLSYSSDKLDTSITFMNPDFESYSLAFVNAAMKTGARLKLNYIIETEELVNKMIATKTKNSNVVKGECIECGDNYIPVGTEIDINGEKFNVISQTDDTVTMLAQYNIGINNKQTTENNYVAFSEDNGWEYSPGPKEIDIQMWSINPKSYVNEYVEYLKDEMADDTVNGDLLTLKDLQNLGCQINNNYSYSDNLTCDRSEHSLWLVNNQYLWTRSADSGHLQSVWTMRPDGSLFGSQSTGLYGVRPTITISKDTLRNLDKI